GPADCCHRQTVSFPAGLPPTPQHCQSPTIGHPLTAAVFAIYAPEWLKDRHLWGLKALATEIIRGYQYLLGVPVLLGLWWFRNGLRTVPGAWVLLALCVMQAVILYRLAVHIGYLSERHVQLLVLCGIFTGVAAVATIGDGLARFLWAWVRPDVDGLRSPRTNSWIRF